MNPTLALPQTAPRRLTAKFKREAYDTALARAHAAFAREHSQWAASLFDRHFLTHGAAALLTAYTLGQTPPDPAALAYAWADQVTWFDEHLRQRRVAELTPIASRFLQLLGKELCAR